MKDSSLPIIDLRAEIGIDCLHAIALRYFGHDIRSEPTKGRGARTQDVSL